MRPYLTILRDSFHEALASRVLWMILIVITILLVAIAPLGVQGLKGPQLDAVEVFDPPALAKAILEDDAKSGPSVGKHILERLPKESRARIEKISGEKALVGAPATTAPGSDAEWLAKQLNPLLESADFFDEAAWKKVRLRSEAKKMRIDGLEGLSGEERVRYHRLAFEAAFPKKVAMLANRKEQLAYLGFSFNVIPPAERSVLQNAIGGLIYLMLKFGVGVAGVLAGLFVTSTIIPQTFEAGAVDLLFSKPVVRSGVYLTKFIGGCAFVLIMAVYFVGGIWLLAGWRFGLWNGYLLATVPVFVFIFAVYYSISCLAGAYWRNPIVSVTMAVLFWAAGWTLTLINGACDLYITVPLRIIKVVSLDSRPLSVAELGEVRVWDEASGSWQEVFRPLREENMAPGVRRVTPFAGPIFDPPGKRIVAIERPIPGAPQFGPGGGILVGLEEDYFARQVAGKLPPDQSDASAIYRESDGTFLIAAGRGLLRWTGKSEEPKEAPTVAGFDISSIIGSAKPASGAFTHVGPDVPLATNFRSAFDSKSGELALMDDSAIYFCQRGDDGKYAVRLEQEIELEGLGPIAFAGGTLLVALEDLRVLAYNAADGKLREPLTLPGGVAVNTMFAAPDGKTFALLTRDKEVYLYDAQSHSLALADITGQGNVTAIAINDRGELLAADRTDRVTVYALPALARTARYQPSRSWLRFAYDFVLYPIYRVVPKPRELDQLTVSLISDLDQTRNLELARDSDMNAPQESSKWTPVRDNAIFVAVMLVVGCWYVTRRDY